MRCRHRLWASACVRCRVAESLRVALQAPALRWGARLGVRTPAPVERAAPQHSAVVPEGQPGSGTAPDPDPGVPHET